MHILVKKYLRFLNEIEINLNSQAVVKTRVFRTHDTMVHSKKKCRGTVHTSGAHYSRD